MKKRTRRFVLLFLLTTSMAVSCKKDDHSTSDDKSGSSSSAIFISGSWKVSYYQESNNDHTVNFSGYNFTFNSNGSMTVMHSGTTANGTWSSDDSKKELHMSLGSSTPLSDLNNGWTVISMTSSEIVIKDDDVTHNEELHFAKI